MLLSLFLDSYGRWNDIDENCYSNKQARTEKLLLMFVCLSSPFYIHMYAYVLLLLPTPILHSYITEKKKDKKEKKKKREKERKNGRLDKKEKKTVVRTFAFVVFARSVPCRALYCGVASGATATRSIVVALRFSHHRHQQQAAGTTAVIATERERERKKRPHPRVCV
jgi:cytoskeletal protein RodZ